MPPRASTPFLQKIIFLGGRYGKVVSMPSRASTPFLRGWYCPEANQGNLVSMPFLADAPFLQEENGWTLVPPILVSMPFRAGASFLQLEGNPFEEANTMYQCPLGLVLHFYIAFIIILVVIAAAMYQCPFRLVLHFYNASEESHFVAEKNVSMPFRASAPFLRTPSKT